MKTLFLTIIFSVFILTSCSKKSSHFSLGEEVALCYGEESTMIYNNETYTIEFSKLIEDSRCPEGAMCIWEGRALVELKVNDTNTIILAKGNLVSGTAAPYVSNIIVDKMNLILLSIEYKRKNQQGNAKKYFIKLRVEEI